MHINTYIHTHKHRLQITDAVTRTFPGAHGNQQRPLGTQQEALSGFWLMQISELGREHSPLFWTLSPARIQLDYHRAEVFQV